MLWNTDFPVFTIFQCEYELRLAHLMWWWIIWNIIIQFKKTIFYCSPAGTETLICLCCDLAKDEPIWMKNVRRKNIFICIWKKNKFYKPCFKIYCTYVPLYTIGKFKLSLLWILCLIMCAPCFKLTIAQLCNWLKMTGYWVNMSKKFYE